MGGKGFKILAGIPPATVRFILLAPLVIIVLFLLSAIIPLVAENTGNVPTAEDAPWGIQTYSYIRGESLPLASYYAKEYSVINGEPTIAGYWEYNGKRYVYRDKIKPFPRDIWGPVTVVRRPL